MGTRCFALPKPDEPQNLPGASDRATHCIVPLHLSKRASPSVSGLSPPGGFERSNCWVQRKGEAHEELPCHFELLLQTTGASLGGRTPRFSGAPSIAAMPQRARRDPRSPAVSLSDGSSGRATLRGVTTALDGAEPGRRAISARRNRTSHHEHSHREGQREANCVDQLLVLHASHFAILPAPPRGSGARRHAVPGTGQPSPKCALPPRV